MKDLQLDVLREFSEFLPQRDSWHGFGVERRELEGFDIEDPAAMEAERVRLERLAAHRRQLDAGYFARRRVSRARRLAARSPCPVCGAHPPKNNLGVPAIYCGDACRKQAHYERNRGDARRRVAVPESVIAEMRAAKQARASYTEIARRFGVPKVQVWRLVTGQREGRAA